MILNTKKNSPSDQTGWEKFENRLRNWIYTLMHELLQSQVATATLYKILLVAEGIQFLWYSIHEDFPFIWKARVADWFQEFVKYFQFDDLLTRGSDGFFVACLFVVFAIQIIILITALFTTWKLTASQKKTSTILAYCLKILSIYGVLLNTIFMMPFFHIFLATFICSNDDTIHGSLTCYEGGYFGYLAVSIIGFILHFGFSILFTLLFIDLNPSSSIPFAAPQSKLNLIKLAIKFIIPLYSVIDYKREANEPFMVIYMLVWIFILLLRYRQTPFYTRSVFNFVLVVEACVLWSTIVGFVQAFIDVGEEDESGIFYLFFVAPLFAYGYLRVTERRQVAFRRKHLKNFKKETDVEMYINIIYDLIENRDKPDQRMALDGLLKYYVKHSNKKDTEDDAFALATGALLQEDAQSAEWYRWVKSIMVLALENHPKSARLHLLYAYIQREKLNNKFKALYEMMITQENKPNIEEEFSIYRYKNIIEEEMNENDLKNTEARGIDINTIVQFQNKFVEFQQVIEIAVERHLDFWKELLESNPDIIKLQNLGSLITHSVEETQDHFKKLSEIRPNNIKMLLIYGNFLKDIVNDENEGNKILERASYVNKSANINKQFVDNDRLKYGENSDTCIVTVSGNYKTLGLITNVNNDINRILNYSKTELINQSNVSRLIPKAIADLHDGFMKNYFETSESKVMGMERTVFPINKQGYMVPCSLMIKVLPNLDDGIRLVGFLKEIEKDSHFVKELAFDTDKPVHYIMYSTETGLINGVTYSCKQDFGIPSRLVQGGAGANNEFTIDVLFPEIHQQADDELKNNAGGNVMIMDTSNLQQNYLVDQGGTEESDGEDDLSETDKLRKFRKTKVRATIIQDNQYTNDVKLRVLKFCELENGDEEFRKESSIREGSEGKQDDKSALVDATQDKKEDLETKEEGEKEEVEKIDESHVEGHGQSEEGSSQADNSLNEDIRALKDFKALISEKNSPKSIKILSRSVFLVALLLVTFASINLVFKFRQRDRFEEGVESIAKAYNRHNLMAEINYKIRKLELLSRGMLTDYTTEVQINEYAGLLKEQLINLIDTLSTTQFEIMKVTETLKERGVDTIDSTRFTLQHQLENGGTRTEERIYTDSIFQYITAASSIRNASLTALSQSSIIDSTRKNFFFVRRNGMGPLRIGSEAAADTFYDHYIDQCNEHETIFLGLMCGTIGLLVLSLIFLIPFVFSVHRTNNKVLSLFGFIPLHEINELAYKAEQYMNNWLEDHQEKNDYSMEASEEDIDQNNRSGNEQNQYLDVSQNPEEESLVEDGNVENSKVEESQYEDGAENETPKQGESQMKSQKMGKSNKSMKQSAKGGMNDSVNESNLVDVSEHLNQNPIAPVPKSEGVKGLSQFTNSQQVKIQVGEDQTPKKTNDDVALNPDESVTRPLKNSAQKIKGIAYAKNVAHHLKEQEEAKNEEQESINAQERSEKLLNSKDNNREQVICKFSIVGLLFAVFFIVDFVNEQAYLDNVEKAYVHLQLSVERMPNVRYVLAFTFEEIAELELGEVRDYPTYEEMDYRLNYKERSQDNDKAIADTQQQSYPSEFDDYFNLFATYNNEDVCEGAYGSGDDYNECIGVADSLLVKGLSLAVTSVALNTEQVLEGFDRETATAADQQTAFAREKLTDSEAVVSNITAPMDTLIATYQTSFNSYLDWQLDNDRIKFAVFVVFTFIILFGLWMKYLKSLNDKIFRTKGMLNMIPMDIISKNEYLREKFVGGDILQAVK